MNRTLVFGIAMFVAVVGIALLGSEKEAAAGHGCHGCFGVACDGGHGGLFAGRCHGHHRCHGRDRCHGRHHRCHGRHHRCHGRDRCHGHHRCHGLFGGRHHRCHGVPACCGEIAPKCCGPQYCAPVEACGCSVPGYEGPAPVGPPVDDVVPEAPAAEGDQPAPPAPPAEASVRNLIFIG